MVPQSFQDEAHARWGEACDLLQRLAQHPEFGLSAQELEALLVPEDYVGRSPEQVTAFLEKYRSRWE